MHYWLMKSEPDVYSIDDLKKNGTTFWDGVRNYQARNFMRDEMKIGDLVLFYHSNSKPSGIVGIAKVCREAYPDETAQDKNSPYFDPKASKENPRWFGVDLKFVKKFKGILSLEELKSNSKFKGMLVTQKGSRLSIQPVEKKHFEAVKAFKEALKNSTNCHF